MSIVFFHAPMSSAVPVASALRELDVAHERVTVDLAAGDQRKPAFLALNPNGKVPTLVVDGAPMFETLAIVQWLGERYGVAKGLWPAADSPARLAAMSWSTWAYVTYGAAISRLNVAGSPRVSAELHNAAQVEHAKKELQGLLAILDAQLAARPHLLGESFSLADLLVSATVTYGTYCGAAVDAHPHVKAWLDRCSARPSFKAEWGG